MQRYKKYYEIHNVLNKMCSSYLNFYVPKKSIEGAVGGVLGAALLGAIYAAATGAYNPNPAHTPLIYAIICGVGALVSMVGDLAASAIKRQENIKDYGTLIPGHGGILDRFDSVIFTAPVIYALAITLM